MKDVKIDRCELAGGSTRLIELKHLIKEAILKTNPSFISFISVYPSFVFSTTYSNIPTLFPSSIIPSR